MSCQSMPNIVFMVQSFRPLLGVIMKSPWCPYSVTGRYIWLKPPWVLVAGGQLGGIQLLMQSLFVVYPHYPALCQFLGERVGMSMSGHLPIVICFICTEGERKKECENETKKHMDLMDVAHQCKCYMSTVAWSWGPFSPLFWIKIDFISLNLLVMDIKQSSFSPKKHDSYQYTYNHYRNTRSSQVYLSFFYRLLILVKKVSALSKSKHSLSKEKVYILAIIGNDIYTDTSYQQTYLPIRNTLLWIDKTCFNMSGK